MVLRERTVVFLGILPISMRDCAWTHPCEICKMVKPKTILIWDAKPWRCLIISKIFDCHNPGV